MNCVDKSYEDVEFCEGQHTISGFYNEAYIIKPTDILKFPKFADDKTLTDAEKALVEGYGTLSDAEKAFTLVGDITLKAGKKMTKIRVIDDTGEVDHEYPKPESKNCKTTYGGSIQNTTHNKGVLHSISTCILVLVPSEGPMQIMGRPGFPARLVENKGTNKKSSDISKKIDFKFEAMPFPTSDYRGAVPLTPVV
ncbi:hypothetical protein VB796_06530 [Arcicella sp. LKC2W]|uniref:hypothetical protein n=1 Tax=Arcicella sp. LKC2W TaxID=2984198 RepID=UPI002B212B20|nr:hypothetical protein [Arcicella sp. LKC2W]MEA5458683.1 hypothetical protein [Arcicella sp. LKC2W]